MNRHVAIEAERRTLDEIAALNRRIETLNLLIVYHPTHPALIRLIDEIRQDYLARLQIAQRRRARLAEHI